MTDGSREQELRRRLAGLVHERRQAEAEADRLRERARLPGADPDLHATADRWAVRAGELDADISSVRAQLRAEEAATARERADDALGPQEDGS
jgi:uncharacterized protein (DUF3084 family)